MKFLNLILKKILIFIWLCICFFLGTLTCFFRWKNPNIIRDFARLFGWGALKIAGIQLIIDGEENLEAHQPCIYLANHQGSLDLATFGSIYPKKTVTIGKKELLWIPFFGFFFYASGNIMIDRKKRKHAVDGLNQAVKIIQTKHLSIGIFPEGTRNRTENDLLPFKKGAFYMAIQAQVPIVPMICGPIKQKINGGNLKIKILPPISTQSLTIEDVDSLLENTRKLMLDVFQTLK